MSTIGSSSGSQPTDPLKLSESKEETEKNTESNLPDELILKIFNNLDDLKNVKLVNKNWNAVAFTELKDRFQQASVDVNNSLVNLLQDKYPDVSDKIKKIKYDIGDCNSLQEIQNATEKFGKELSLVLIGCDDETTLAEILTQLGKLEGGKASNEIKAIINIISVYLKSELVTKNLKKYFPNTEIQFDRSLEVKEGVVKFYFDVLNEMVPPRAKNEIMSFLSSQVETSRDSRSESKLFFDRLVKLIGFQDKWKMNENFIEFQKSINSELTELNDDLLKSCFTKFIEINKSISPGIRGYVTILASRDKTQMALNILRNSNRLQAAHAYELVNFLNNKNRLSEIETLAASEQDIRFKNKLLTAMSIIKFVNGNELESDMKVSKDFCSSVNFAFSDKPFQKFYELLQRIPENENFKDFKIGMIEQYCLDSDPDDQENVENAYKLVELLNEPGMQKEYNELMEILNSRPGNLR